MYTCAVGVEEVKNVCVKIQIFCPKFSHDISQCGLSNNK